MQYKAIIFDLDGTLSDSIEDIADSLNPVLKEHNFPTYNINAYKQLVGNGLKKLVHDAIPIEHRDSPIEVECTKAFYKIYSSNCLNKTKPYDGINDLLNKLNSKKIKYAILSNKAEEFTKQMALTLFPKIKFDFIVGVTIEQEKKPNPKGALKISEALGFKPEEIIFVGDGGVDMQTANNAGMLAVGALWGFKSKEELEQNGAKYLIKHPFELLQVINSLTD
jgi:phosphoglycolate phosphatase